MKQSNASPIHGGACEAKCKLSNNKYSELHNVCLNSASIYMTIEIVQCLMKLSFYRYVVLICFRERYTHNFEQICILIDVLGANL